MKSYFDNSVPKLDVELKDAERNAGWMFAQNQFKTMATRHPPEEIIKFQVLMDYGQQAAQNAKQGRLAESRHWLAVIDGIHLPAKLEFEEARLLSLLPVWALVRWREGELAEAICDLERALTAGHILATQFGHGYLTTKLIHLAANVARVQQSAGENQCAIAIVAQLRGVIAGDASLWPYHGASLLKVPLEAEEREIIEGQLRRTEGLANAAVGQRPLEVSN